MFKKIINSFRYRKINKEIIRFLDYDKIFYHNQEILIQINSNNEDYRYCDWGEIRGKLIRIRDRKKISQIHQDLKIFYNKERYRKEKFRRLLK